MAGIVIITTNGGAKRYFVNTIQKETASVKLAILQKSKKKSLLKRMHSFYKKVGLIGFFPEVYNFLFVKLSRTKKQALAQIYIRSKESGAEGGYLAETLPTTDVNEDSIYERIKEINPDIIAIFGGHILKSRLLELAPYVVNIHFGFAPYYRGVNGIENAIINNDFEHIGITIHYAVSKVDAGEIIKVVTGDHKMSPEKFFKTLNDTAIREYVNTVKNLFKTGKVASKPQDITVGKNYFLREWTYEKQNTLAKRIMDWSKTYGNLQ